MKQADENTIWGPNRKYNIFPKQKTQAEPNTEITSGPHDEQPHGGGRQCFSASLHGD